MTNIISMRFSEILLLATALTGVIVFMNVLFLKQKLKCRHFVSSPLAKPRKEPWWIATSQFLFPVLLLVLLLRSFLAEPFKIPSGSMKPTLLEGDRILVTKFNYGLKLPLFSKTLLPIGQPKRGDVIVFRHSQAIDMIKRVVGLPGDRITYRENILYINGTPMAQQFIEEQVDSDIGQDHTWRVRLHQEQLDGVSHQIFLRVSPPRRVLSPLSIQWGGSPGRKLFCDGRQPK